MKKLFLLLTACVMLLCLTSCRYKADKWFSDEKLAECLVPDLPKISESYVNKRSNDIYVKFTEAEYNAYVTEVYEYLKSQSFDYLGTRGELHSSLSGAFSTYYFEPASELSEFESGGGYRFVYSDGSTGVDDEIDFCIIIITSSGFDGSSTLEYGLRSFDYNTVIKLRFAHEEPLGGSYTLKECEHTGEWIKNETTHFYQYTCGCESPDIAELHSDNDKNYICDICDYVMPEHKHTYEEYRDEIGHGWEYTCGCLTPPNFAQHLDGDGDGKCDYCKYYMLVEGNHFLRNQSGCEWLNELTAKDIAEIKIISERVGIAPGNLKSISSSANEEIIARIFEEYYWLDTSPISRADGEIDGGGAVTAKFILKDGAVKELYINNGNYRDTDGNYFDLLYTPMLDGYAARKSYSFITYRHDFSLHNHVSGTKIGVYYGLEDWEFTDEIDDEVYPESTRYVEADVGIIYICTDRVFYVVEYGKRVYYSLTGDFTFDDIEDYRIDFSVPYSITYEGHDRIFDLLLEGYAPTGALSGDTVVIRTATLVDADLELYANVIKIEQTHSDSDYTEHTFIMPSDDVSIRCEIVGGI